MKHQVNGYLKNPNHAITIDVVGCGGTGSLLIPRLAKMNFALKHFNNHPGFHLRAYDFDRIEYNNIGRQNFFPTEIGDYKSINIVEKVNIAYGTNWEAFTSAHDGIVKSNIIITCVDTLDFRELIHNRGRIALKKNQTIYNQGLYWLDCGNGKNFGQVIISNLNDNQLKDIFEIFPDIRNQKEEDQKFKGCSYIEKFQEQELFVNDIIASEAADLLWDFFTKVSVESQGIIFNQELKRKQPIKIL